VAVENALRQVNEETRIIFAHARNTMGERCYICGGSGRRSSFVAAAHGEVEGDCPDCLGTGWLPAPKIEPEECNCGPGNACHTCQEGDGDEKE
jgi:hypothetical protein